MPATEQIVDKILEDGLDSQSILRDVVDFFNRENQLIELAKAKNLELSCGFYISTGDESVIEDNLREDGIDPRTLDWESLVPSFQALEHNLTVILFENNGLQLNTEGHDSRGDLIGTIWLPILNNQDQINTVGIDLMRQMVDSDEPISESSGTIRILKGIGALHNNVDERIARAACVSFGVYGYERMKVFFEELDAGTPMAEILPKIKQIEESFLAPPEPPGIFRKIIQGVPIFTARCPGCKRIHGEFRTYDQAAGNRQCKFCNRDYVDKMTKVRTTGNFKHILKKDHEARASKPNK